MIKLNLQFFGGRGGGSGGSGGRGGSGGIGGGEGVTTGSVYHSHRGSAGGSGNHYGSQPQVKKTKGTKVSSVNATESYFIAADNRGKEGNAKAVKGTALSKLIRSGELVYNPNIDKWEDKRHKKYIIRRK